VERPERSEDEGPLPSTAPPADLCIREGEDKASCTAGVAEHRVRHVLEVARIYAFANRREEAIGAVLDAERDAPEQVRYHYIARELAVS
jgi:hypothetical protein